MQVPLNKHWVEIFKALGHGTRLQIVIELLDKGTKCVTDIQDILPYSQSNISQHLTILRNADIVDFTQDGSQRCYFICDRPFMDGIIKLLRNDPHENKKQAVTCCVRDKN
jgi:ArsR family transcriptional regulator